jgi:phosphoribosyl 1,2-cyclic phosphate phosphodiesterase
LKNKFTILGCGSSLGSPWITNYWGKCNSKNKKNLRTRCCAHFQYKDISVLIDTSPDIKQQIIRNKIKNIDAVIYTHEHADQTSGIFELRPYFWINKKKLDIYASNKTMKELKEKYDFVFKQRHGYIPIGKANVIKDKFFISKSKTKIQIEAIEVPHGMIKSTGLILNKIAYLSDCSSINLEGALDAAKRLGPRKTILTNLHVDLDYSLLKKKLPSNIIPAFDGMSFTF